MIIDDVCPRGVHTACAWLGRQTPKKAAAQCQTASRHSIGSIARESICSRQSGGSQAACDRFEHVRDLAVGMINRLDVI